MGPLKLHWIDAPRLSRLAVMPRPHAKSFVELKAAGVDVVVSLLEADEASRIGLADEAGLCRASGIEFLHLPVADFGIPSSREAVIEMSERIATHLRAGRGVAVHCHAGRGRSPLLACAVLIDSGMTADTARARVSSARGMSVPETAEQAAWLIAYERRPKGAR
jgi:protein-tyrosine phosphatase